MEFVQETPKKDSLLFNSKILAKKLRINGKQLGEAIKKIRAARDESQSVFATHMGLEQAILSSIENEAIYNPSYFPTDAALKNIAIRLGYMTIEKFLYAISSSDKNKLDPGPDSSNPNLEGVPKDSIQPPTNTNQKEQIGPVLISLPEAPSPLNENSSSSTPSINKKTKDIEPVNNSSAQNIQTSQKDKTLFSNIEASKQKLNEIDLTEDSDEEAAQISDEESENSTPHLFSKEDLDQADREFRSISLGKPPSANVQLPTELVQAAAPENRAQGTSYPIPERSTEINPANPKDKDTLSNNDNNRIDLIEEEDTQFSDEELETSSAHLFSREESARAHQAFVSGIGLLRETPSKNSDLINNFSLANAPSTSLENSDSLQSISNTSSQKIASPKLKNHAEILGISKDDMNGSTSVMNFLYTINAEQQASSTSQEVSIPASPIQGQPDEESQNTLPLEPSSKNHSELIAEAPPKEISSMDGALTLLNLSKTILKDPIQSTNKKRKDSSQKTNKNISTHSNKKQESLDKNEIFDPHLDSELRRSGTIETEQRINLFKLGKNIGDIRGNVKQAVLAKELGISPKNLSFVECGKSFTLTKITLENIAEALSSKDRTVTMKDFLKDALIEPESTDLIETSASYKKRKINSNPNTSIHLLPQINQTKKQMLNENDPKSIHLTGESGEADTQISDHHLSNSLSFTKKKTKIVTTKESNKKFDLHLESELKLSGTIETKQRINLINLGDNILQIRKKKKCTQEVLASQIGVNAKRLSSFEKGKSRTLTQSLLENIAKALSSTLGDLLKNALIEQAPLSKTKALSSKNRTLTPGNLLKNDLIEQAPLSQTNEINQKNINYHSKQHISYPSKQTEIDINEIARTLGLLTMTSRNTVVEKFRSTHKIKQGPLSKENIQDFIDELKSKLEKRFNENLVNEMLKFTACQPNEPFGENFIKVYESSLRLQEKKSKSLISLAKTLEINPQMVGKAIALGRNTLGLNQKKFFSRLIDRKSAHRGEESAEEKVDKWETGESYPTDYFLEKIASVFGYKDDRNGNTSAGMNFLYAIKAAQQAPSTSQEVSSIPSEPK
ncbi:MAG: helix-turn-helix transcriptional regulator [Chlamydiota bacterium]